MSLLVRDILTRPFFKNVKVLAGKAGLDREVKWVHIVEIAKFGHLLNGKEVILTTGLGWVNDEEKSLSFLQQLLDCGASALCIELVSHTEKLPQNTLHLAEQHRFPIISFQEEVRFIDITKDLHELLIGYHEEIWWRLERLYNQLNNELISNGSIGNFLKILHKETTKQIALKYEKQYSFFPSPPKNKRYQWIKIFETNKSEAYYTESINLLGNPIAYLYFVESKSKITQFDQLALKRCGEILHQFFWKYHLQREAIHIKNNEWIFEVINGRLSHEEITSIFQLEGLEGRHKEVVISVIPFEKSLLSIEQSNIYETTLSMLLRPIFLDQGFHLFTVQDHRRNMYILLLINQQDNNVLPRLEQALKSVRRSTHDSLIQSELQWISFGKIVSNYNNLNKSYQTALSTLNHQLNIEILNKPFYNSLTVHRLIDQINNKKELKEIILDYLKPLIDYDQKNGTELLRTLQVFLNNLGAKSQTAEDLYIVRQTLYHRLNRIGMLIGDDFMKSEQRFMIEFSLYALKYVDL